MVSSNKETEMKKNYLYSMILMLATMFVTSCENDSTEGLTSITYYPQFTLEGGSPYFVEQGTSYSEPGMIAMEGETDRTADVDVVITNSAGQVVSSIDVNNIDLYTVTYSVTNEDGILGSAKREVIVYNPNVTDISGTYTVAEGTLRLNTASGAETPYSGYTVNIEQIAPGFYYVSDYMAGFYDLYYGYGSSYAMKGYMKQNSDNTLEIITGNVAGWGDSFDSFRNGIYDAENNSISYVLQYASTLEFYVNLTK